MTTITVSVIKPGPKRSRVITTEGREYGFWTDKAGALGLEQGGTYNIEPREWKEDDHGNMLYNIVRAKRLRTGVPAAAPAREPFESGVYRPPATTSAPAGNPTYYRPTHPVDAKRMFVTKLLGDAVTSGAVPFDLPNLTAAANVLMEVYRRTMERDGAPIMDPAE